MYTSDARIIRKQVRIPTQQREKLLLGTCEGLSCTDSGNSATPKFMWHRERRRVRHDWNSGVTISADVSII